MFVSRAFFDSTSIIVDNFEHECYLRSRSKPEFEEARLLSTYFSASSQSASEQSANRGNRRWHVSSTASILHSLSKFVCAIPAFNVLDLEVKGDKYSRNYIRNASMHKHSVFDNRHVGDCQTNQPTMGTKLQRAGFACCKAMQLFKIAKGSALKAWPDLSPCSLILRPISFSLRTQQPVSPFSLATLQPCVLLVPGLHPLCHARRNC